MNLDRDSSLRTFEGRYEIKEYKNHNGNDYPFTIDTVDEATAKKEINKTIQKYISDNNFFSAKITDINERY